MAYGVIGEDDSDVYTLRVLIRRLEKSPELKVKCKSYGGCGGLLKKGASQLVTFHKLGLTRFVVAFDADRKNPEDQRNEAMIRIVNPSGVGGACCLVVPFQEIEAWILADLPAVGKVFRNWQPSKAVKGPEFIYDPKEYLERISRQRNKKPIYNHATHNELVAGHLDLTKVARACSSFRLLKRFVEGKKTGVN